MYPEAFHAGIMGGGDGISARSYVRSGLVHMWDAIENAGFGIHDSSATTWKDLAGNADASVYNNIEFTENSIKPKAGYDTDRRTNAYAYAQNAVEEWGAVELVIEHVTDAWFYIMLVSKNANYCVYAFSGIGIAYNSGAIGISNPYQYDNYVVAFNYVGTSDEAFVNAESKPITTNLGSFSLYRPSSGISIGGRMGDYSMTKKLHAVRIYNRNLTQEEISANYAIDKARFGIA